MVQPPSLARQVNGTRRTGIARGGRTQHQGANEAVVLPNLGLLASTTIFLVNLPWYNVTISLRRLFLDVPPLNLLATSWLLATALSADVNISVVGLTRTVLPSLLSYHPSSSPSMHFSISPSPDTIPSFVFNTFSAFTDIIICIMISSNKSNACSGRT
jgi:hypothetical protein